MSEPYLLPSEIAESLALPKQEIYRRSRYGATEAFKFGVTVALRRGELALLDCVPILGAEVLVKRHPTANGCHNAVQDPLHPVPRIRAQRK